MPRTSNNREGSGGSRLRVVLAVVVVLLVLMLGSLGVFFVKVLKPAGLDLRQSAPAGGLVWVKSMYGFGPSKGEQLLEPTSVAIAPNGTIYASDPQRARVMAFTPGGAFERLVHTGAGGAGKGQFARPESLACDSDGNLYIADSWLGKVIVFGPDGKFVREWEVGEAARGVFVRGEQVYVLGTGKLYVFDLRGKRLGDFGRRGRGAGQIDAYQGVTTDGERIYIAEALNRRMQAFDRKGNPLWIVPDPKDDVLPPGLATRDASASARPYDMPTDVVLDGSGRLVAVDAFKFEIVVSDPKSGKVLARYGQDGETEGQFFYPSGIDYDASRDWFAIADTRNNRVQIVRLPGSGGGAASAVRRAMSSPYRYCALPLGLLLLAAIVAALTARRMREGDEEALPETS